jgi:hypothetical protein
VLGCGEVDGGVARLQSAGGGGAEGEQPDQEQREGRRRCGDDREHGTENGDQIADGEPGPPPRPVTDPGQRDGDDGGTQHAHRLTETGRRVGPGDVPGEQSADRDAHGHAESGEGDTAAHDADGAALDEQPVDVGQRGHRPSERPMISFMISFVPP